MSRPLDTREVEFAYVSNIAVVPNIRLEEWGEDGQLVIVYKSRISIDYELKDTDRNAVGGKSIEHYSDAVDMPLDTDTIVKFISDNLATFVADDKYQLSGFKPN